VLACLLPGQLTARRCANLAVPPRRVYRTGPSIRAPQTPCKNYLLSQMTSLLGTSVGGATVLVGQVSTLDSPQSRQPPDPGKPRHFKGLYCIRKGVWLYESA
jgi:hypothetical protein